MGSSPMITRTASEIAELCGATLEGDGARSLTGPAALGEARAEHISFLGNPRYVAQLAESAAGAVIVARDLELERGHLTLLRVDNPNRAFSQVIELFRPPASRQAAGVHASAVLAEDVELGEGVSIGALAVVAGGACLGAGVVLHQGASVGPDCRIGANSVVHPNVTLGAGTVLGERCCVHAGSTLGSDGFGYDPGPAGWEKVPQCGSVELGDDVEIGANCAIDRGRFGPTRILSGTKIDNLVHVAHNVQVGPGALLIAQVGLAGSCRVGKASIIAGQAAVNGHVSVGDHVRVGGQSGVIKDLLEPGDYWGTPILGKTEQVRAMAVYRNLPKLQRRVKELEAKLEVLLAQTKPGDEES